MELNVGVIIGRFQTPFLHEAHRSLIQRVCDTHKKVIIILGCSPLRGTMKNPLDIEARTKMIREAYPDVIISYIKDCALDEVWSKNLDLIIKDLVTPSEKPILYGSRDSFIPHYKGKYKTLELESDVIMSATELRMKAYSGVVNNSDFRTGVIWQTANKYPTVYTTVDVAIFNEDKTKMLLGRKPNEVLFRFIGGFSDPKSSSFEADARREVMEEAGIELSDVSYVGSCLIDDWRYRSEQDKIKTLIFVGKYQSGKPTAGDDIAEISWRHINTLTEKDFVPEHRKIFLILKDKKQFS